MLLTLTYSVHRIPLKASLAQALPSTTGRWIRRTTGVCQIQAILNHLARRLCRQLPLYLHPRPPHSHRQRRVQIGKASISSTTLNPNPISSGWPTSLNVAAYLRGMARSSTSLGCYGIALNVLVANARRGTVPHHGQDLLGAVHEDQSVTWGDVEGWVRVKPHPFVPVITGHARFVVGQTWWLNNETLHRGVDGGDRVGGTVDGVEPKRARSASNLVGLVTAIWCSA